MSLTRTSGAIFQSIQDMIRPSKILSYHNHLIHVAPTFQYSWKIFLTNYRVLNFCNKFSEYTAKFGQVITRLFHSVYRMYCVTKKRPLNASGLELMKLMTMNRREYENLMTQRISAYFETRFPISYLRPVEQ